MAELTTIARPYAEAAFELARDANALPAWSEMLRFVSAVVADAAMAAALDNPQLDGGRQGVAAAVGRAATGSTRTGSNFVRVLVEADRVALLPQIAALFEALKNDAEGVAKATIETRVPADRRAARATQDGARKALRQEDRRRRRSSNPELIGGARITVGDTVIDGSVQAQLAGDGNAVARRTSHSVTPARRPERREDTMQLNPSEISELIKSKIQNLDTGAEVRTQGTVVSVTDGICRIHGLSDAMQGEMLEFPGNTFGLALNLERDSVGAVILGEYEHITEGDTVKCTGRILVGAGRARS